MIGGWSPQPRPALLQANRSNASVRPAQAICAGSCPGPTSKLCCRLLNTTHLHPTRLVPPRRHTTATLPARFLPLFTCAVSESNHHTKAPLTCTVCQDGGCVRPGCSHSFELHFLVAVNMRAQATLATTDTSPSSPSRGGCTKSVCVIVVSEWGRGPTDEGLELDGWMVGWGGGRWVMLTAGLRCRICLQGDHGREHHVDWSAGQRLRRGPVTEEGAGRLSRPLPPPPSAWPG